MAANPEPGGGAGGAGGSTSAHPSGSRPSRASCRPAQAHTPRALGSNSAPSGACAWRSAWGREPQPKNCETSLRPPPNFNSCAKQHCSSTWH